MQAITDWSKSLRVEVRGEDVVGHAGNVIPRMLADATGLTGGLSAALSRPEVLRDRGVVLRDVAVSIAGGAQNLAGTAVLRDQGRVFGQVASIPTMWRSLNEIDDAALTRIMLARNKVRERVWQLVEARHGRIPPSRTCYGDLGELIVIRIDATLCDCHSDKECAAGNFKGGYGHHPLTAWARPWPGPCTPPARAGCRRTTSTAATSSGRSAPATSAAAMTTAPSACLV